MYFSSFGLMVTLGTYQSLGVVYGWTLNVDTVENTCFSTSLSQWLKDNLVRLTCTLAYIPVIKGSELH
uniref:Uncharacterized protein n=1 Tax=Pararge aegeria TaxID=116150 RepID=S4P763_9NEOP